MTNPRAQQAAEAVRYRLRRVEELGGRLGASIQEWGSEAGPKVVVHEDRRGWDVHVEHPTAGTVDEWTYLYSEAVHHLRSALDNMVWALADVHALTAGQQRRIAFPVLSGQDQWANALQGALRTVPQDFVDRIFEAQPFHEERSPAASPLTGLQDMSNADKHRLRVQAAVTGGLLGINANFTWPGAALNVRDPERPPPVLTRHDWRLGTTLHHTVRTRDRFAHATIMPSTQLTAVVDMPTGDVGLTRSIASYAACVTDIACWVTEESLHPTADQP